MATPVAPQPHNADNPAGSPRLARSQQPFATIGTGLADSMSARATIPVLTKDAGYTTARYRIAIPIESSCLLGGSPYTRLDLTGYSVLPPHAREPGLLLEW